MLYSCKSLAAVVLLGVVASPSFAQAQAPAPSEWTFALTPYAWLMGVNGSLTAKGQTVNVSANVIDLLGKTDTLVGLMGNFEARKDKYSLYIDAAYTHFTASRGLATQFNPRPNLNVSLAANGGVSSTMAILEGGGAYELARIDLDSTSELPTSARPGLSIDALLGFRYWHVSNDITMGFQGAVNAPGVRLDQSTNTAVASTGNLDWVDPIVGVRLRQRLAPHHEIRLQSDVGGFGVGSQFSWQVLAAYSYEFSSGTTSWAAILGYRALGVNYATGTDGINMTLSGPVLGLTIRF